MGEMVEHPNPAPRSHPLLQDRARLDTITKNMHVQIQLVLHRARVSDDVERVLPGGESEFDVLQEALLGLLRTPPAALEGTWEALAFRIAQNKAKDALTRSTRGRRSRKAEPGSPDDVTVVAFDEGFDTPDVDLPNDPHTAYVVAEQHQVLFRLARETLTERQRLIFWTAYYKTQTDKELGERLGISGQAIGQQRRRILRDLYDAARRDPSFPTLNLSDEGELR